MEAIVLAGGKGTRLFPLTKTVPKPMVPVAGKPFLAHLLTLLKMQGIQHVILSIGYLGEQIQDYFGDSWQELDISYVHENEPLGTGGAIVAALKHAKKDVVFVINGDTYCEVNYKLIHDFHRQHQAEFTQVLKPMQNFDRYGNVILKNDRIIKFEEKRFVENGLINTGIYLLNNYLLLNIERQLPEKFSFEDDFMQPQLHKIHAFGFVTEGYFIDIGVPEDLAKIQQYFKDIK